MPRELYSVLGPVSVTVVDTLPTPKPEETTCGVYKQLSRAIELSREVTSEEARIETLFHEWVHVALLDSGLAHLLDENVQEAVCDAVGGLLAGAALNGMLVLRNGK